MQITVVLPFTFHELVDPQFAWRHHPDAGAAVRLQLLIRSFIANFDQRDLREFLIVCPSTQCYRASLLLSSITCDPRYVVMSEDILLPNIRQIVGAAPGIGGWHVQQLIKIAAARYVSSAYYLTMDSDIVCTRRSRGVDFVVDSGGASAVAFVNVESKADYARLYKKPFAEIEVSIKQGRYDASALLLGYTRQSRYCGHFYGETPCIIHTAAMGDLIRHIDRRHHVGWDIALCQSCGWTEYGLYFQFLEMTEDLEHIYAMSGCNRVLDLERSVWQENVWYRQRRRYDEWHFRVYGDDEMIRGPFVAVQSWLPTCSWLPKRCQSLQSFYGEMAAWFIGQNAEPRFVAELADC